MGSASLRAHSLSSTKTTSRKLSFVVFLLSIFGGTMKVTTAGAGSRPRVCDLSLAISELVKTRRAAATGGALLASALAIVPVSTALAQAPQEGDQVLEEV